ncbi:MAG: HAMP domain-containing protein [Polyangiaceae bacterium]|nr:HAMP domain-containing protein [Polyangiaceae bacterium]
MRFGIRSRLFATAFGLIAVTMIVAYLAMRNELERLLLSNIRGDLHVRTALVALEVDSVDVARDDFAAWDALADRIGAKAKARVTLIRRDGVVIGDSEVPSDRLRTLQNHGSRPEVVAALAQGFGESARFSATVEHRTLYAAVPFGSGGRLAGVARVAVPLTQIDSAISKLTGIMLLGALAALAVAAVLSMAAAHLVSRTARSLIETAGRMAEGDLNARARVARSDEYGDLGRALDQLAQGLAQATVELRAERDRLSGIVRGMHEGVLLLDREGRIELFNPALREMLLLEETAQGMKPLEVVRHAELKELLDEARSSREDVTRELEITGLRPRRLMVRAARLPGQSEAVFAVFVDVTEMRRLESLRREFVANVSHELRTPIATICSAAETLVDAVERDPGAVAGFVQIIERNAVRLRDLIEDVLNLSRIESREFHLSREPLALEPVLGHIAAMFSHRARAKGIEIVSSSPGTVVAFADRRALEHVLTNLVDNATKYCGTGARVGLRAERSDGSVVVSVSDNGPGIEQRHLSRLFERFYRVDTGRSRELGGTGLGLAIVKHLVEAMNGEVRVESTLGQGTTFSFTLPEGGQTAAG